MGPIKNPLSPGVGSPPPDLAGRAPVLEHMAFTVPLFDVFMKRAIPHFIAKE